MLKKSLELFVFRVKAMLTVNKCHEAFWIGNLRNRDITGQEINEATKSDSDGDDSANKSDVSHVADNHSDLVNSHCICIKQSANTFTAILMQ